jgi:hypothetical protein
MLNQLRHHHADVRAEAAADGLSAQEASDKASAAIGNKEQILAEALARQELKSWGHRWPWAIYGLAPASVLILSALAIGVLTITVLSASSLINYTEAHASAAVVITVKSIRLFLMYFLPVLIGASWCIYAARRGAPVLWPSVAICLIAFIGSGFHVWIYLPTEIGTESARISAGWTYFDRVLGNSLIRLGATLSLLLATYFGWRSRFRSQVTR